MSFSDYHFFIYVVSSSLVCIPDIMFIFFLFLLIFSILIILFLFSSLWLVLRYFNSDIRSKIMIKHQFTFTQIHLFLETYVWYYTFKMTSGRVITMVNVSPVKTHEQISPCKLCISSKGKKMIDISWRQFYCISLVSSEGYFKRIDNFSFKPTICITSSTCLVFPVYFKIYFH